MAKESGEPMKPADPTKNGADPAAAIRSDIERTRGQMASNVNAIEERLSPAHIKEQIASVTAGVTSDIEHKVAELKESVVGGYHETKDHLKEDLGREIRGARHMVSDEIAHARAAVREATVGRVEHMVHDARESVSEAGTSIIDTIKQNPIPAALIGVGLGWLLFGGKSSSRRSRQAGVYAYGGSAVHDVGETAANVGHRVQEGASHLVEGAQGAVHDVGEAVSHFAHDASDRIGAVAGDARQRGGQLARGAGRQVMRVERGAESVMRENPLAVGAVALAIGAAIGLSLPHTQVEDEWMGDTKERLFHQAEEVAGEAIHKAEEAVGQLTAGQQQGQDGKDASASRKNESWQAG
jgi:ElaB/YqjD/DUF883 family membrane-anchored ribosome-binding protein